MTDDLKSAIQALSFGLGIGLLCKAFSYSRLYSICIEEYSITDVRAVIFGTMILATVMFIAARFREFLEISKFDTLIADQLKRRPGKNLNWGWFRFLSGTIVSFVKGPLYSWLIIFCASMFVFADLLYFLVFNSVIMLLALFVYSTIIFPNGYYKGVVQKLNSESEAQLQVPKDSDHWSFHALNWLGVLNPNAKTFLTFSGYSLIIGLFLFPGIKQDFGGGAPKLVTITSLDSLSLVERRGNLLYLSPDHYAIISDSSEQIELIRSSQITKLTLISGSSNKMDTKGFVSSVNSAVNFLK